MMMRHHFFSKQLNLYLVNTIYQSGEFSSTFPLHPDGSIQSAFNTSNLTRSANCK